MTHGDAFPRVAWLASEANPDRRSREAYARLASQEYVPAPGAEDAPPAEYPPRAAQLAAAVGAAVRFVASGCATVDRAEFDRRKAICRACRPHYDPAADRCRKCGCALSLKPWAAGESCPVGKW